MTTKKKTRRYRGLAPSAAELDVMHALGYVTPTEAGEIAGGLTRSAIYQAARRGRLPDISGDPERPPRVKRFGKVWLLRASIERMAELPGAAT